MADTPENPPHKKFSRSDYLRRKAEREASLPPSERGQSGLLKAAEEMARGSQMVSNAFKQTTDGLVKASIEGVRAGRAQRKADMEEAFSNALTKSKAGQLASSPVSHSVPDEIQEILGAADLWDAEQSGIPTDQSFSQLCNQYIRSQVSLGKVLGVMAAALAPLIAGFIVGSATAGFAVGLLVALVTIVIEILLGLFFYLFFVPSQIVKDVTGDLDAARKQIAEDKFKLNTMAVIAKRHQQESLEAGSSLREIRNENAELTTEKKLLTSQLDSSYKVVLEVDTVGRSAEVSLPQRSRINFIPVPGDDNEWATGCLLADIRMRFDSRSETTRVRINSVVAFLVIGTSQRPVSDVHYFVGEKWDSVDFEDEAYSHVEPLKKSPYYLMSCNYELSADEIEQLRQNVGMVRLVMDAVNQPNYCVDLAIGHWDEIETCIGSAVTVLKKGGCPA
jgi:hypothetical protein